MWAASPGLSSGAGFGCRGRFCSDMDYGPGRDQIVHDVPPIGDERRVVIPVGMIVREPSGSRWKILLDCKNNYALT